MAEILKDFEWIDEFNLAAKTKTKNSIINQYEQTTENTK